MIIYGASGHGKVICDIIKCNSSQEKIVFVDDAQKGNYFYNHPVFLTKDYDMHQDQLIIAIGNNLIRRKVASRYINFGQAIHPTAVLSKTVSLSPGTVIMANVSCNADTQIGEHVILNTSCSIDHDCEIHDFAHISPNVSLAGNVKVGTGSHIGIGATVIQGIKIGNFATIGAGTVVINDIPDGATAVGIPAKIIKFNK
ncbi:acetyltransferase [Flavobacteriaceae bacterium Ap0902]|nr:acetyltransferase [Flavobacteriaceae bacterium Ap0902]